MIEITFVGNQIKDWKGKRLKTLAIVLTVMTVQADVNMWISQKVWPGMKSTIKFGVMTHHIDNFPFCNSGFLQDANRFHNELNTVQNMHKAMRQK